MLYLLVSDGGYVIRVLFFNTITGSLSMLTSFFPKTAKVYVSGSVTYRVSGNIVDSFTFRYELLYFL